MGIGSPYKIAEVYGLAGIPGDARFASGIQARHHEAGGTSHVEFGRRLRSIGGVFSPFNGVLDGGTIRSTT